MIKQLFDVFKILNAESIIKKISIFLISAYVMVKSILQFIYYIKSLI